MESDTEQTPEEERTRFAVTHEPGKVLLDIQGPLRAASHTLSCAETLDLVYRLVRALSGASMATGDTPQGATSSANLAATSAIEDSAVLSPLLEPRSGLTSRSAS